jgi:hypothetical protein
MTANTPTDEAASQTAGDVAPIDATAQQPVAEAAPTDPAEYVAFLLTLPPRDRDAVWVALVIETLWDRAFAEQPQPWGVIEQIVALQLPSELWPVVVPAEIIEIIKRYVEYREWRNVLGCLVSIRSPAPVDFVLINRAYRKSG